MSVGSQILLASAALAVSVVAASAMGPVAVVLLFAGVSLVALRELVTLVPSRRGDHATLVAAFFLAIPIQYALVAVEWWGLAAVFVPVYAFLALSVRIALSGDTTRFLHRVAALQYALLIGVYCVSHAPALILLDLPRDDGRGGLLLLFLVLVVQAGEVCRVLAGRLPAILAASGLGAGLAWLTPFTPVEALGVALLCALAGWGGGVVTGALQRDAHLPDPRVARAARAGPLDRIAPLAFAAPVLFHLVRWGWPP